MNWLRHLAVRRKLMLMIVLSCGTALCLAGSAFVGYDFWMFRRTMVRDLTLLADLLGNNSTAALSFNARDSAEEMLGTLRTQPHIATACLYDKSGRIFATYRRSRANASIPAQVETQGGQFESDRLTIFRQIWLGNKPVGTIYLESDLTELTARLRLYTIVVSIKIVLVLLFVLGLSTKLQDFISRPILALTATAKAVSEHRNYALRAQKTTEDELGVLTDTFNEMLAQIQHRDAEVRRAHDELEARVAERTAELSQANAALQVEIGERKCAEAGLRIKTEELARSNTELEQFAYIASHDLQEPLRMVSSYLQLLEQRYTAKLDATAKEFINYAVDGAARMRTLVRDLLEYSRVGRRKQELARVNCRTVFDTILLNLKETIADAQAQVTAGDLPTVQADATELTQLFQNLIANAIKFHGAQPPAVHVEADRQDTHWHFTVRDNGIGIAPEFADRIFVIFQRLHTRTNYPGNGLGLAICKKIVERYGGRIWVQSAPGHGATFHFTLPAVSIKDQKS